MKLRKLLALYMGVSLLFVGPAAFADDDDDSDDDDEDSPKAVQVMIDPVSGVKTENETDAQLDPSATRSASPAAAATTLSVSIPGHDQTLPEGAEYLMGESLGSEHMKYLVVYRDENGELRYAHSTLKDGSFEDAKDLAEREER